jgi:hypothetical protein
MLQTYLEKAVHACPEGSPVQALNAHRCFVVKKSFDVAHAVKSVETCVTSRSIVF